MYKNRFVIKSSVNEKPRNSYFLYLLIALTLVISLLPIFSHAEGKGGLDKINVTLGASGEADGFKVATPDNKKEWGDILSDYRTIIVVVTGMATITLAGAFVLAITKLGTSAGNPQARSEAIKGLLWTGVATGLIGSGGILFAFFFNVF